MLTLSPLYLNNTTNMKLSAYLLGLGAVTSTILFHLAPAFAQIAGGSDNNSGRESVSAPRPRGTQTSVYASAPSQSAVDQFSQSLTVNSVGDAATFDVINGAAPAPLVAALLPSGAAADGSTAKAAANLANTVRGMRASDGKIDASKLNASVEAYNGYVKAMVSEIGPEKALTDAPVGQKAIQGVLSQLIQAARLAAPSAPK
jgi:hypothetical protein